jgi:hypothetical protein
MEGIIDDFDHLRPVLAELAQEAPALPLASVRLRAPLPRPHKILCALANYPTPPSRRRCARAS